MVLKSLSFFYFLKISAGHSEYIEHEYGHEYMSLNLYNNIYKYEYFKMCTQLHDYTSTDYFGPSSGLIVYTCKDTPPLKN